MEKFLLFSGCISILISLEFFAKSLRVDAKRNSLGDLFLKLNYKGRNFYRHVIGKKELKVIGIRFNAHDKFILCLLIGMFLIFQSLLMGYEISGGMASVTHQEESLFKRKFSQKYDASNYPSRVSEVVYKINFEAESYRVASPEKIGEIVADGFASAGAAMYADPEKIEQGMMASTTTNNVQPKGEYVANFNLKIPENIPENIPVAVLEVFDTQANKYLAQKEVFSNEFKQKGKYQNFKVPFTKRETGNTQYRLLFTGKSALWLDKISIDPQFDNWVIYDPRLYYDNVPNEGGENLFVREAASLRDLRGQMTKIPLKEDLPNGTYKAIFRLKTKNLAVEGPIAKLEVNDKGKKINYFHRIIEAKDFNAENEFQDFELEFDANKLSKIELSVFFFDAPEADLYVDTVSVKNF